MLPPPAQAVALESAQPASLARQRTASRPGPLVLWHLLSLDAPTVAVVWTWFVAHTSHLALSPPLLPAMFLAVWLLYAGDRLLDTRGNRTTTRLEARHRFHARHHTFLLTVMSAAGLALLALTCTLPSALLRLYLLLAALLAAWFALVHTRRRARLPKEFAPGLFFAVTVFAPVWLDAPTRRASTLLTAALFGAVCCLNCLFISRWESPSEETHHATRLGVLVVRRAAWIIALATLVLLPLLAPELRLPALAAALAAFNLLALDAVHPHLHRTTLRAAADLVLLTPLLCVLAVSLS